MNRSLIFPLLKRFSKIYFSNRANKGIEYKKTLFYYLKDLGGVYIKFLQAISVMGNFMDDWGSPKEFEVFNKVAQEPIDVNEYITSKDAFKYIEKTPFATGSFAQVYKGKLKTDEIVAVKVLRPSVSNTLEYDLEKLRSIIKIVNFFLPNSLIDYKGALEEFSTNCLLETDYKREVSNMEYFYKLYNKHPNVIIPKAFRNLCTDKVIVQDFIEGPTLADLISDSNVDKALSDKVLELTGSNVWTQITIAGAEALKMAICADYVFGDPHPGNIILLQDNKIAFIDFGIVASKPKSQEAFYNWTKAYYEVLKGNDNYNELLETTCMCFCPDLSIALKKCSLNNDFIKTISNVLDLKAKRISNSNKVATNLAKQGHIVKLFSEFVDSKNAINLKLDLRNFALLKAMQSFLSTTTTIDNRHGNNYFSTIMLNAMECALDYCDKHGVPNDLSNNTRYTINESYELLVNMLSSIAEGDEFLFQNISERTFL